MPKLAGMQPNAFVSGMQTRCSFAMCLTKLVSFGQSLSKAFLLVCTDLYAANDLAATMAVAAVPAPDLPMLNLRTSKLAASTLGIY